MDRHPVVSAYFWEDLPDEDLLKIRIRDLGLRIDGTPLEERVKRLHLELETKGLGFRPACYLADEWLCPDKVPIIGIPFFLAHPRLSALEKKMMLEVEGETEAWCLKLLRHETGHAINYAYRLFTKTRWRELFGPFSTPYYEVTYSAKPYSKRYVQHLEDNYAQAHPDEDFAETFAVWLAPESNWREKYREWPALKKLLYVDHLMREIGPKQPLVAKVERPWAAARMEATLAFFYERKRRYLGDEFPGHYDASLLRIFAPVSVKTGSKADADPENLGKASFFLRRHRKRIVGSVSMWLPQRKFDIDKLIGKMISRCENLGLYAHKSEEVTIFEVTSFVTAVMSTMRRFNGVHGGK